MNRYYYRTENQNGVPTGHGNFEAKSLRAAKTRLSKTVGNEFWIIIEDASGVQVAASCNRSWLSR